VKWAANAPRAVEENPLRTPAVRVPAVRLLSSNAAAELLGIAPQSLRLARFRGNGPPFLRLSDAPSGRVYYAEDELAAWVASRPRYSSTADEKRATSTAPGPRRSGAARVREAAGRP
jgi:hypothetical protein